MNNEMYEPYINSSCTITFESLHTELNENINLDLYINLHLKLKSQLELNTRQLNFEIKEICNE